MVQHVAKMFFQKNKRWSWVGEWTIVEIVGRGAGGQELLFKHEFNKMLEKNFFPIHCAINHSFRVSTKTVYILWMFVKMTFTRISQDFYLTLFLIYLSFQKLNRNIVWKRSVDWNNRYFIPDKDRVHANIFTGR